jgi:hypothetical protein
MSELPPYTGSTSEPAKKPAAKKPAAAAKAPAAKAPAAKAAAAKAPAARKPAAKTPAPAPVAAPVAPAVVAPATTAPAGYAPVVPGPPAPYAVVWHSRALLISVAGAALLAAILTGVGSANFPSAAPVEQLYAFGLIVDLLAVVATVGAFIIIEFVRRGNAARATAPVNRRPSVFAIIAVVMSGIALVVFVAGGGGEQFVYLVQGIRGRYMYWTGALFVAGIPWALGAIFGAWGFRPRANLLTNVLAAIALVAWLLIAALTVAAALIYGADLSD